MGVSFRQISALAVLVDVRDGRLSVACVVDAEREPTQNYIEALPCSACRFQPLVMGSAGSYIRFACREGCACLDKPEDVNSNNGINDHRLVSTAKVTRARRALEVGTFRAHVVVGNPLSVAYALKTGAMTCHHLTTLVIDSVGAIADVSEGCRRRRTGISFAALWLFAVQPLELLETDRRGCFVRTFPFGSAVDCFLQTVR